MTGTHLKSKKDTLCRRLPPQYVPMLRLLFWTAFVVVLGLGHVHLRLVRRDVEIQRTQLQAEWAQLHDQSRALTGEVESLRANARQNAQDKMQLTALPPDQVIYWRMPKEITDKYDTAYAQVALSRSGAEKRSDKEPLMARLLGTVLSPEAQAKPERRR